MIKRFYLWSCVCAAVLSSASLSCRHATTGEHCQQISDCETGLLCQNQVCAAITAAAQSCTDHVRDNNETDIDCGGNDCPGCAHGKHCQIGNDCADRICTSNVCTTSSCTDGTKNGLETDVDCGGGICPTCLDGRACQAGTDCTNHLCYKNVCVEPTCTDHVRDGRETDVDCGGNCAQCIVGQHCKVNDDCQNSVCINTVCTTATCSDGVKDQDESDVDCGGIHCATCALGKACTAAADCKNNLCSKNVCASCQTQTDCGSDTVCRAQQCNNGICSHLDKPDGTLTQSKLQKCEKFLCIGGFEQAVYDATDIITQTQPPECTSWQCSAVGTPATAVADDTLAPSAHQGQASVCYIWACWGGTAKQIADPNPDNPRWGIPPDTTPPNDCRKSWCGSDGITTAPNPGDLPLDPGYCKEAWCGPDGGTPTIYNNNGKIAPDAPGDCLRPICANGNPGFENDDGDHPADTSPGDCKKNVCSNGTPQVVNDDSDVPTAGPCEYFTCSGGNWTDHCYPTGQQTAQCNGDYGCSFCNCQCLGSHFCDGRECGTIQGLVCGRETTQDCGKCPPSRPVCNLLDGHCY